jgi:hypothetical protein
MSAGAIVWLTKESNMPVWNKVAEYGIEEFASNETAIRAEVKKMQGRIYWRGKKRKGKWDVLKQDAVRVVVYAQ